MKKLFITGASGFLGYHLLRVATGWEVYGVTNKHSISFNGATLVNCDIRNYIELGNFIDDIEPDAIIHTAAISDANFCQQNRELSYDVNVEASKNLAGIAADYNIPFAFTSTDLVFDGKKGMYKEDDAKSPVSIYGEQKSVAEGEVLKIYPNATVFRLPLIFGEPNASEGNYLRKFIEQLRKGDKATLFYDEYRSVCGAKSVAEGLLKLMHNPGIIHLAGKERLSRYDFGVKVAEAYGLDKGLLQSISQKDIQMAAPRPADVSLDIWKAISLGFNPMGVDDELKRISDGKYL